MGRHVGCLLDVGAATDAAVKDAVSRLGASRVFIRGGASGKVLRARAPACSSDGRAPGLTLADDDAPLRAALAFVRKAGAEPYLVLGNPFVGCADWSDLLARDNGGRLSSAVDPEHPWLCPSQPKLLKWAVAATEELARTYKPAGFLCDDLSLGSPEKLETLFLCWCDRCQARAVQLGYDPDRVRVGLQGVRSKLGEKRAAHGVRRFGLGQFLDAIGYDTGLLDWLNFRADLVSSCLYEVRHAVTGVDSGMRVGVLTKAPTVAFLAAQRRADLVRDTTLADFYAPVVCGHGGRVVETILAHSRALAAALDVGAEAEAVAASASLHGYEGIFDAGPAATPSVVRGSAERELALALAGPGDVPRWPAIDVAGLDAGLVDQVADCVNTSAAEGVLYLGVPA